MSNVIKYKEKKPRDSVYSENYGRQATTPLTEKKSNKFAQLWNASVYVWRHIYYVFN